MKAALNIAAILALSAIGWLYAQPHTIATAPLPLCAPLVTHPLRERTDPNSPWMSHSDWQRAHYMMGQRDAQPCQHHFIVRQYDGR